MCPYVPPALHAQSGFLEFTTWLAKVDHAPYSASLFCNPR
ncbi:hypothetical protein MXB_1475 [Myxobolus squamalis]|nr:hypothetical protein MXB_1475 [Myxobolus squamalis]